MSEETTIQAAKVDLTLAIQTYLSALLNEDDQTLFHWLIITLASEPCTNCAALQAQLAVAVTNIDDGDRSYEKLTRESSEKIESLETEITALKAKITEFEDTENTTIQDYGLMTVKLCEHLGLPDSVSDEDIAARVQQLVIEHSEAVRLLEQPVTPNESMILIENQPDHVPEPTKKVFEEAVESRTGGSSDMIQQFERASAGGFVKFVEPPAPSSGSTIKGREAIEIAKTMLSAHKTAVQIREVIGKNFWAIARARDELKEEGFEAPADHSEPEGEDDLAGQMQEAVEREGWRKGEVTFTDESHSIPLPKAKGGCPPKFPEVVTIGDAAAPETPIARDPTVLIQIIRHLLAGLPEDQAVRKLVECKIEPIESAMTWCEYHVKKLAIMRTWDHNDYLQQLLKGLNPPKPEKYRLAQ